MSAPALSVILVAADGYAEVATTIRHLRAQTIASQIELVIVAPKADHFHLPDQHAAGLGRVTLVEVADVRTLAVARAAGIAGASASYVVFSEDHSFPEPGWAAALLAAHERGYAGIAPEMKNGNPATALSWAAMFLHFGGAVEPGAGFETDWPAASHNMSYRRDALLELGDELSELMLAELFLHRALRARGHKLWVEPAAATRHVNSSRLAPALRHAWIGGRLYGGLRCKFDSWSVPRRIAYAGGSALIPFVRLRRVIPEIRRTRVGPGLLPRVLVPVVGILIVHAAGEAAGYLFGVGNMRTAYSELERKRHRFVRAEERALWA
jgi:hypothetical protein